MRKSLREMIANQSQARMMGVDFHDFLAKHNYMTEEELGVELGLTKREIDALTSKIHRG